MSGRHGLISNPGLTPASSERRGSLRQGGRFGTLATADNQLASRKAGGADGTRKKGKALHGGTAGANSNYHGPSSRYSSSDTDEAVSPDNAFVGHGLPGTAGATTRLAATSAESPIGVDGLLYKTADYVGFFLAGGVGMVLGVAMLAAYRGVPRRGYNRLLS